jgi:hypothetical protein
MPWAGIEGCLISSAFRSESPEDVGTLNCGGTHQPARIDPGGSRGREQLIRNPCEMPSRLVPSLARPYNDRHQAQSLMDVASLQVLKSERRGFRSWQPRRRLRGRKLPSLREHQTSSRAPPHALHHTPSTWVAPPHQIGAPHPRENDPMDGPFSLLLPSQRRGADRTPDSEEEKQ